MKYLYPFIAVLMLAPLFVKAQTADPELDHIKKVYSKDKKVIVDEYMALDVQQGAKFWPVYGAYESRREKLALERLNLINEYINSDSLSAGQTDKLASKVLANSISLDKLNLEYYKKMKKAVGAITATKYIQLETYLQSAWRGFMQENIPLIGELDKTQKN